MDLFERYIGKVIDNRYKVTRIIGSGGMAVVFEAFDLVNNREVALKLLRDDIAKDPRAVKRFINESKAISMMSHPNIVKIYAISVRENLKYIVMERVQGITLKNYINKKGALPYREALLYTRQILKALEHAHSKGIVHRDIKPQNIMLLKNGLIKVTDFGIAKLPDGETISSPDKAIGTVYYISPEQAGGKEIDQRSDLYSLGIVMYEMMTGILPFRADTPVSVALKQINEPPRRPREYAPAIPVGVEQVVLAAMEKRPERRFQSASQMLDCVSKLLEDPSIVFNQKKISDSDKSDKHGGKKIKSSERKRSGRTRPFPMLPIVIGIFVAVAIVSAFLLFRKVKSAMNVSEDVTRRVEIEDYVGKEYTDELEKQLADTGFKVEVISVFSDEIPAGTVIEQKPAAHTITKVTEGKQNNTITFRVSAGKQSFMMPDLSMKKEKNAQIELRPYNVEVEIIYEASETVEESFVIYTEPEAGQALPQKVYLHVSTGPTVRKVAVPDLTGKTVAEASELIKLNSLSLGELYYENSESEKDKVIKQSIAAGTEVVASSKIDIVVSKGPAPKETEEDKQIALDNYSGSDIGRACNALEALGLKYRTGEEFSDDIPSGFVIRTEPGAGSSVKIGSEILIVVSKGKSPAPEIPETTEKTPETEAPGGGTETQPASPSEDGNENKNDP